MKELAKRLRLCWRVLTGQGLVYKTEFVGTVHVTNPTFIIDCSFKGNNVA